jgi:hypothetical protein
MSLFEKQKGPESQANKAVRMESVLLRELWSVARDNITDYVDHFTRAEVHYLNTATAIKPDAKSDEAYA